MGKLGGGGGPTNYLYPSPESSPRPPLLGLSQIFLLLYRCIRALPQDLLLVRFQIQFVYT